MLDTLTSERANTVRAAVKRVALTQLEASREIMMLTLTLQRWRVVIPVSHWTAESRLYSILDAALPNRFDERPVSQSA